MGNAERFKNPGVVGEVRTRMIRGKAVKMVKEADGVWRRADISTRRGKHAPKAEKPVIGKRGDVLRYATRTQDLSTQCRLVIPELNNMVVYHSKDKNPDAVKKKYIGQHKFNRERLRVVNYNY